MTWRSGKPAPAAPAQEEARLETVAENLDTPWEIAFLPDGDLLVAERPGILRVIGTHPAEITVPGVAESGEGGYLGLALHPDFAQNRFVYLYFTTTEQGNKVNRVIRYVFDGTSLQDANTVIEAIPASNVHNGGRLAFGPDGFLYVTTGDAGAEDNAQDTGSLAGKILRVADDGSIPNDNPFGNAVYSYGHRNPQGLAWDDEGGLWSTEHGRSGVLSGYDEVNFIEKGANYGWPEIQGDETREGMRAPAAHSGATKTWAPASLAYRDGVLYFAGLRGEALYQVPIVSRGTLGDVTERFTGEYGRLRAVSVDAEGSLFFSTSNKDGRGKPQGGDDRVITLVP